jgi:anthranilate phosphoribosyltransferase
MHSIAPYLRRIAARRASGPPDAGDSLDVDEAQALWGAVLDGAVPDLELGALVASLSIDGGSVDELLGLHRALAARCSRFPSESARRAVAIPVYGLVPGEAAFAALLALFLRRFDVPVLLHGSLESACVPSAAMVLRELGVLPCATIEEAERRLRAEGLAFVPAQLLSPAFASVLALRSRLGVPNPAHVAAHALDPGATGAVRLVTIVPGTRTQGLAPLIAATEGDALVLTWPTGETPANAALRPRIALVSSGSETLIFDCESAHRTVPGLPDSPSAAAPWIRDVVARKAPAPTPLVNLAAACVHASGAAHDFTQAKAIVALQSGRMAA